MADTSFFGRLTNYSRLKLIVTIDKMVERKLLIPMKDNKQILSSLRDRYTKLQKSFFEHAGGATNQWHTNKFVERYSEIMMQWIMTQY